MIEYLPFGPRGPDIPGSPLLPFGPFKPSLPLNPCTPVSITFKTISKSIHIAKLLFNIFIDNRFDVGSQDMFFFHTINKNDETHFTIESLPTLSDLKKIIFSSKISHILF